MANYPPPPFAPVSTLPLVPNNLQPMTPVAPLIPIFPAAALYVGDLDPSVTEGDLVALFSPFGNVTSVRVCRDVRTGVSLRYAYVNYRTRPEATKALENLKFTSIKGKPMRIMFSNRDPTLRKSGYANIIVKNLDTSIDNKGLFQTFLGLGPIISCKVATHEDGHSKGYGFVQFERNESAEEAVKQLDGMLMREKKVSVCHFVRREERHRVVKSQNFTTIYVKKFSETITDEDLRNIFGIYGVIQNAVVIKDNEGKSKCFGYVSFEKPDDAASAVENMNGKTYDDRVLCVERAQSKYELRLKFEKEKKLMSEKLQGANLYVKNLDDSINDEKLKELFSEFGTITSCKVMLDEQGQSKGFGFVAFSLPEEASRAKDETNGKMVGKKPLYVAVAQRKEERKAKLQAQFGKLRAPNVIPSVMPSGFGGYSIPPTFAPPQTYHNQAFNLMPHQSTGYGFRQMMPQIRPGVPNFVMPYNTPITGHFRQMFGNERNGNPQNMQPQFLNPNTIQGYQLPPSARFGGRMPPRPHYASGISSVPVHAARPHSVPSESLASTLASSTPEQQRMMLGNQLYPLVEQVEPANTAKVTGMLLEMDETEVLHLIESQEALKEKVAEAMEVLQKANASGSSSSS